MSTDRVVRLQEEKASLLQSRANRTQELVRYKQMRGWESSAASAERDIADLDRRRAQLAADLELAKNTVVRAYRSLEQEGLVSADRRHGTTVNEPPKPTRTQRQRLIAEATRRYLAELAQLDANHDEALAAIKSLAPR